MSLNSTTAISLALLLIPSLMQLPLPTATVKILEMMNICVPRVFNYVGKQRYSTYIHVLTIGNYQPLSCFGGHVVYFVV